MATAKANKKMAGASVDILECPVCLEPMRAPIFQCQSGHSLCSSCTQTLSPPICPICRQAMTQMRNWQLEEMISKLKVPCRNKSSGCVYTMPQGESDDHLKECIFREMDCPLGLVFGKCSWSGKLKEMMDHFKDRHAEHCNATSDTDVDVRNVNIKEDDRRFYLVAQGKMLFIITMKIDTLQKMAYWSVQHIGSKKAAQQHVYEIHVASNQDARRKVTFAEYCFNDAIKVEEVFRQGKCAVIPLDVLGNFIKDKKLSFRFFIKRIPPVNENNASKNENKAPNPNQGQKGPGPKHAGFKGPGPHGPGNKPGKKQNKPQA